MKKQSIIFLAVIVILIIGGGMYLFPHEKKSSSTSIHLIGFEQAINSSDWTESQKYLAPTVYVILESSSCCGNQDVADTMQILKRVSNLKFTFDEDSNLSKEYLDYIKSQYPNGRKVMTGINFDDLTIGVENDTSQPNKAKVGYKVENGKVNLLFVDPGRDR